MTKLLNHTIFILMLFFVQATIAQQDSITSNQLNDRGQKTGVWKIYYDNDSIKETGHYLEGQKNGLWKAFYRSGNLKHEITFEDGVARGPARFYYKDGTLWEEGYWNETHWVGEYNLYHANGQKFYEWQYNNLGRRTGEQKYYHENGQLQYAGEWQNGSIRGEVEVFNEAGEMVEKRHYADGSFQTSKVITTRPVSDQENTNKKILPFYGTGHYILQSLDGFKVKEGYFRDGVLQDGKHYFYNEKDSVIKIRVVENGKYQN
ncbi:toxin-antitoxin system YwqK family antitoxin [Marinilabilia rubra]|uniref:Toxin-antitoxin system YwqK family antitoxin n=1 Tax=Marinilabilia rubra TaxID=2162893 RepID=A0A2U2B7U0_9BACT|nr:toxin-antitoxin system YwqK family antitoxin [Marinilabilia rubra]PWD99139.1 toxin-antitoxin system YwqK family antitoxin [Marinilabilia rubra]